MPDTTPTPAQAPGQAATPSAPQQQAPQSQPPSQAAPTPPATSPTAPSAAPATPPAQQQPPALTPQQISEIQRSNSEAQRKITEQGQQLAQQRQQLERLVGATPQQPQVDQLAPYVKMFTDKGYAEKEARDFAEVQHAMMQPVLQAQQQSLAAIQGTSMVNDVLRQAWTESPTLFAADPQIGQRVEQMLRHNAVSGQGPVDKDFALAIAKIEWADRQLAGQQGQPPPQPQWQPPSFNSMFSAPSGFTAPSAPTPQKPVLPPEAQGWDADIKKSFKTDAR